MGWNTKITWKSIWNNRIAIVITISVIGSIASIISFFIIWIGKAPIWVFATGYFTFAISIIGINVYETNQRRNRETDIEILKNNLAQNEKLVVSLKEEISANNSKYPMLIEYLHNIFHSLRDCTEFLLDETQKDQEYVTEKMKRDAQMILTQVVEIFNCLYGGSFSSCIKLCYSKDSEQFVRTFCRDIHSERIRDNQDLINKLSLDKNTDFSNIVSGSEKWFYSADLQKENHYVNERKDWSKYYLCTAVLPIQYVQSKGEGKNNRDILGFLCLDSKKTGACPQDESVELLASIADTLFIPLKRFNIILRDS